MNIKPHHICFILGGILFPPIGLIMLGMFLWAQYIARKGSKQLDSVEDDLKKIVRKGKGALRKWLDEE